MSRVDPLENLKKFEPKTIDEQKKRQNNLEIEKLANQHGFVGRNSIPFPNHIDRAKRRFKTGRNVQINIKGDIDTKNELYRIADYIDQPLGETLKRALAALQRELQK
ncbi:hypothetical protein [Candidatus Arsenophonus triatominarum]|uniref:hypothetical protein n=1 Tax=Candidatus Arsenophonus triatominarum TaxID=57911 RepID=UPI0007C5679E|nr:hypothetical protein [Candidatus Arsenophonus triatominarum]